MSQIFPPSQAIALPSAGRPCSRIVSRCILQGQGRYRAGVTESEREGGAVHGTFWPDFLEVEGPFTSVQEAQDAVGAWVHQYNTDRPHQGLDETSPVTPSQRFAPVPDEQRDLLGQSSPLDSRAMFRGRSISTSRARVSTPCSIARRSTCPFAASWSSPGSRTMPEACSFASPGSPAARGFLI